MYFLFRIKKIKNNHQEVPDDFLNEIHKWSLECKLQRICLMLIHIKIIYPCLIFCIFSHR